MYIKKWSHKGFEILKRDAKLSKCMCVIIPPHQPLPHTKRLSPLSLPFLLFMHFSECLWFCLQDTFYFPPIVVDRLLYLFLFLHGIISIVFKIGSTVLQRTIYDPILEAILIPECTYFACKTLKLFIFDTKTSKTAYCIIF